MASSFSSVRLELLSKDNFDTWSLQIEALLTKNDLWDYVNGNCKCPLESDAQQRSEWLKADKKAKADLVLSIHPSELKQIRGCVTSRGVWLKLQSIYASKGPARKATLLKKLMLHKLDEGGDVNDHMAQFFDAVDKLEDMGVPINGDLLSIMLLYSLPASYENFRCAIESRDELPKVDALKVKILEESEARKQSSGNAVIAMAAAPRKPINKNKQKATSRREFRCFKCGVIGHKASACYSKRGNEKTTMVTASQGVSEIFYSVSSCMDDNISGSDDHRSWILDSGCTTHLCADQSSFISIGNVAKTKVNLANQSCADVKGLGVVQLSLQKPSGQNLIELKNILFVPDLRTNLVSVAKITNKGHKVVFSKHDARVFNSEGVLCLIADRKGDLYYVRESIECANAQLQSTELSKWHSRLGHLNARDIGRLVRDGILPAIDSKNLTTLKNCEICLKAKMTALPFAKGHTPCNEILNIVHSDVVGPFRMRSQEGARYFVTFVDDCTRWCEIFLLREKSGVLEAFKKYQQRVERCTGKRIKCLQTDNGREYINNQFDQYLSDRGIVRRLSIPHTPQQNGVAERLNRTILDMTRCLLIQSGLDPSFWSAAVVTACHVRNKCPTSSLNWSTPYEKFYGEKPELGYFRTFGSKVMVLDKNPAKSKLAPRAVEGIFVGYPSDQKGYKIWHPNSRRFTCARDIKFIEEDQPSILSKSFAADEHLLYSSNNDRSCAEFEHINIYDADDVVPNPENQSISNAPRRMRGRPKIARTGGRGRPRKQYTVGTDDRGRDRDNEHAEDNDTKCAHDVNDELDAICDAENISISGVEHMESEVFAGMVEVNLDEALKGPSRDEWMDDIQCEVTSLLKNDTWDIVKAPKNENVVGCRFILTNKCGSDGKLVRRKARLVAKGYSQKFGVDYNQKLCTCCKT